MQRHRTRVQQHTSHEAHPPRTHARHAAICNAQCEARTHRLALAAAASMSPASLTSARAASGDSLAPSPAAAPAPSPQKVLSMSSSVTDASLNTARFNAAVRSAVNSGCVRLVASAYRLVPAAPLAAELPAAAAAVVAPAAADAIAAAVRVSAVARARQRDRVRRIVCGTPLWPSGARRCGCWRWRCRDAPVRCAPRSPLLRRASQYMHSHIVREWHRTKLPHPHGTVLVAPNTTISTHSAHCVCRERVQGS